VQEKPKLTDRQQQILDWIRNNSQTAYHPIGTCRMGSGPNTVVDEKLRVHGLEALRIADAVRERGLPVRATGPCSDVCPFVFLAGSKRQLLPGARLGFHRVSAGGFNPPYQGLLNRELRHRLIAAGLTPHLATKAVATPPGALWVPEGDELSFGDTPPEPRGWSMEARIIAEDLGYIGPEVVVLRRAAGLALEPAPAGRPCRRAAPPDVQQLGPVGLLGPRRAGRAQLRRRLRADADARAEEPAVGDPWRRRAAARARDGTK